MKHEIRMEMTRQLEKTSLANEGANSRLLFVMGTTAEIIAAAVFFVLSMRLVADERLFWYALLVFLVGFVPLGHAAYLSFNRFMNRRLSLLYKAVLDTTAIAEAIEPNSQ
jgi:hypothetical protein